MDSLYKALVLPLMDFGDIIFMHSSQDNLARLDIIQNNACRLILRRGHYSHVHDMLVELKLPSLFGRRDFHLCVFMYKVLHGEIKARYLLDLFEYIEDNRDRVTRALTAGNLVVPNARTNQGRKCIQICGSLKWNSLPVALKDAKSLNIFKNLYLKDHPI